MAVAVSSATAGGAYSGIGGSGGVPSGRVASAEQTVSAVGRVGSFDFLAGQSALIAQRNGAPLWWEGGQFSLQDWVFQDSAGTTPATAATNPIGLMLDRSYGSGNLGPELVTVASATMTGAVNYTPIASATTVVGKYYLVSYNINLSSGAGQFTVGGASFSVDGVGSALRRQIILASGAIGAQYFSNAAIGSISGVSVREVLGFPALQSNSANRGTLELLPSGYYGGNFGPSTVDDFLTTTYKQTDPNNNAVVAAVRIGAAGSGVIWASRNNTNAAVCTLDVSAGQIRFYNRDDAATIGLVADPSIRTGQTVVISARVVAGSYSIRINGVQTATAGPLSLGTASPTTAGIACNAAVPSEFFQGMIGLVCPFPGATALSDIETLETFAGLQAGVARP